jgi:hypothetical protein
MESFYLLSLAFLIVGTLILLKTTKNPSVEFLKPQDAIDTIYNSPYFKRMTPVDLYARRANDWVEYRQRYFDNIREVPMEQRPAILEAVGKANNLLARYPKLRDIRWRIAIQDLEAMLPHTLQDIIFLPSKPVDLVNVLIHEKIHIYQRLYPQDVDRLLIQRWGFYPIRGFGELNGSPNPLKPPFPIERSLNLLNLRLLRNNPDLDDRVWTYNDKVISTIYLSETPKSILAARPVSRNESFSPLIAETGHPYEIMAYELSNFITKGDNSPGLADATEWLKEGGFGL